MPTAAAMPLVELLLTEGIANAVTVLRACLETASTKFGHCWTWHGSDGP